MGAMRFLIFITWTTWTRIAFAADECATYQEDSRSSALLQKDATVASLGTQQPPGLIMWSYGRSATGSFMESLKESSGMSYCNGLKEVFKV
eukprot:Skav222958  [mRNA]  locus=scaffold1489:752261:755885:- [translate_table: standard]